MEILILLMKKLNFYNVKQCIQKFLSEIAPWTDKGMAYKNL